MNFVTILVCHGTSRIVLQCFLLASGMSRNFTNCLTMGANYLEVVKRGSHPNNGWSPDEIRVWHVVSFLFFFFFTWWQFCIVQILSGPKAFLHISFVFFRSLIGNFLSFFAFSHSLIGNFLSFLLSPTLRLGIFFLFCFLPFFDWEFSFLFSSEGNDWHSHPGSRIMVSWDFGSRLVEWLDMIYVWVWLAVRG